MLQFTKLKSRLPIGYVFHPPNQLVGRATGYVVNTEHHGYDIQRSALHNLDQGLVWTFRECCTGNHIVKN